MTRITKRFEYVCLDAIAAACTRVSREPLAIALLAVVASLSTVVPARAQCPAAWVPGIGAPGTSNSVASFAFLPGGDLIVGGLFTTAGGVAANNIVRHNPSTGVWTPLGSGASTVVYALAVLPSGDVIAGGGFATAGGIAASGIARYNPTTGVWSALGTGTNNNVRALAVLPGGDVIVGGEFGIAGGVAASRIARYNPTTGVWSSLSGGGTNGIVRALAVLPGGDVIVGGDFTLAGLTAASRVARYNPTTNVWSSLGTGTNSEVDALAVMPGSGDVIVGGTFINAGGAARFRIARYNPTANVWSSMGAGTSGLVSAITVLPGGDVIAAGLFATAGGLASSNIARYQPTSPTTGTWSPLGTGVDNIVFALAVSSTGDAFVGGSFTNAGGTAASRIARYFPGAPAPSITTQPLPITTVESGNAVFFVGATGGPFGGTPAYQWRKGGIAINAAGNPSAATPTLVLPNVQAADLASYDCLITNSCGGTGTLSNPATLTFVTDPCPADFNGDGGIDFFDYLDFVDAYSIGC